MLRAAGQVAGPTTKKTSRETHANKSTGAAG